MQKAYISSGNLQPANDARTSFEDGIISYIPIKDFVIDVEEDVQSYELFKNFHKKSVFTKINIKIRRILKDYL